MPVRKKKKMEKKKKKKKKLKGFKFCSYGSFSNDIMAVKGLNSSHAGAAPIITGHAEPVNALLFYSAIQQAVMPMKMMPHDGRPPHKR